MKTAKDIESLCGCTALSEPQEVLNGLFNAAALGFGICDKQLRYRAVNKALATMNGLAPRAHLGKTIREVIGETAVTLETRFRHVFFSGRAGSLDFCAKLPNRDKVGYWILNYFPIRNAAGSVELVGGVVVEITDQKKVQQLLFSVTDKLIRNLLLTAHDSDALLRQIMKGSLRQIPDSGANRNRSALMGSSNEANAKACAALSPREREVVKCLAEGHGNKETAIMLSISVKTVEAHRTTIMLKLGLHTATDLLHYAISNRILDLTARPT